MAFLAVSPNYWGKGQTKVEAKIELRKQGGEVKHCSMYECSDDAYVDDCGTVHSSGPIHLVGGQDFRLKDK